MSEHETLFDMVKRVQGKFRINVPAFSIEVHFDSDFPQATAEKPATASASVPASASAAAGPAVPIGERDHFAKKPGEYSTVTGKPIAFTEQGEGDKARLVVTLEGGKKWAAWDSSIWSALKSRNGKRSVFYVTVKGQYTNIVGVRA